MSADQELSNGVLRLVLLIAIYRAATGYGGDELRIYDAREYGQAGREEQELRG